LNLVRPHIYIFYIFFYKTKMFSFIFFIMKPSSLANPSASKGSSLSHHQNPTVHLAVNSPYHPSLKAMIQAQPFSGHDHENPCHHL
jgi:hypothetical protein